jgi:peptidoglycan/LPS O-acetylase OafA/YrhL
LRIAPLFVAWTLIYFYTSEIDPTKLFIAIVGLLNKGTVPGVGWTIIVEFQFYLLFPLLLFFTQRHGLRYLGSLVALAIFLRWSVWYTTGTVQDLAYSTIFGRIDQFVLCMISGEMAARYKPLFRSRALLIALILTGAALMHWFDRAGGFFDNGGYPSIYWPKIEGYLFALIVASYLGTPILMPSSVDKILARSGP